MLAVKLGDNGQYLFVLFEGAFGKFQMVISGLRCIIEAEPQCGAVGVKLQVGICRRRNESITLHHNNACTSSRCHMRRVHWRAALLVEKHVGAARRYHPHHIA
jgi:hypothetical protein